jgi:hypothetical protein
MSIRRRLKDRRKTLKRFENASDFTVYLTNNLGKLERVFIGLWILSALMVIFVLMVGIALFTP